MCIVSELVEENKIGVGGGRENRPEPWSVGLRERFTSKQKQLAYCLLDVENDELEEPGSGRLRDNVSARVPTAQRSASRWLW